MSVKQSKWATSPRVGSYVKILPKLKNLVTFMTSATKSNTDLHRTLLRSLAGAVAQCLERSPRKRRFGVRIPAATDLSR